MASESSEARATDGQLQSWKAIANYLHRDIRTVQRWERDEGLPVHRHGHRKQATVYAYPDEIDAWRADREGHPTASRWKQPQPGSAALLLLSAIAVAIAWAIVRFAFAPPDVPVTAGKRSIVVLPFADLSEEPLTPMADAMTEEISARLATAAPGKLAVIARTSAMSFKSRPVPVDEMRAQLNVDYALEGSIRHSGGIVRVAADLVDTNSQARVWSGSFDYPMDSWLALQLEASTDILAQLATELGIPETDARATRQTQPEAYEQALLGYHYFDQFGPKTLPDAIAHFNAAIERDPEYVDAQLGLALSHAAMAFFGAAPAAPSYQEVERWASHALALDEANGVAHSLLGWVEFAYRWNWEEAERALRDGVARQPNSPWTHWLFANFLSALNRPDEAVASIDAAVQLDPVSPYVLTARGYILANAHRDQEALRHWSAVRPRLGPAVAGFHAEAYENVGDFDSAVRMMEEVGRPHAATLRKEYESDGERGYWRAVAASMEEYLAKYPDQFSYRYVVAMTKLGETDAAINMLERGYNQRHPTMVYLPIYRLEPLYADARFQDLLQRMNLPAATQSVR